MRTLDRYLANVVQPVVLLGLPEGTEFQWEYEARTGSPTMHFWLTTYDDEADVGANCTTARVTLDFSGDSEDHLRQFNEALRDLQHRHWLATYNIWPGWRV
jgi:hypothetical protein